MRPLVMVLAFFLLLALAACQSAPGPSSALEVHPTLGAGIRAFAGPQDGVGFDARLDLGKYGCRTGTAAETATAFTSHAPEAPSHCLECTPPPHESPRVPEVPSPETGGAP